MRNVWLIARREYLERIRTRSFAMMTVLIPVLMIGSAFAYTKFVPGSQSSAQIAIVAPADDEQFGEDLRTELLQGQRGMGVELISPPDANTRQELDAELAGKSLDGYLWIEPSPEAGGRPTFKYTPKSRSDVATRTALSAAIRTVFVREGLMQKGASAAEARALTQPVDLDNSQAVRNDHNDNAKASVTVLFLLMYFVILLYGMNVARSIIEEKTSRIFEVMLATIQPEEMMAGKMIGVGSVGLTQVAIWLAAAAIVTMTPLMSRLMHANIHIPLNGPQVFFFVIFFLLGYLLYSSMAAALGAMTNSEQELQQLNMFMVMPLASCTVIFPFVLMNSDGLVARVFSLIPFTAPLIMYMRVALKTPPWYEVAGSIALLCATILAILWIASRMLPCGYPHVWKEAESSGDSALVEVQLAKLNCGLYSPTTDCDCDCTAADGVDVARTGRYATLYRGARGGDDPWRQDASAIDLCLLA